MAYVQKLKKIPPSSFSSFVKKIPNFTGHPCFGTLYVDLPPRSYSLTWSIWGHATGLDKIWFFGLVALNRVYNFICLCLKQVQMNLS